MLYYAKAQNKKKYYTLWEEKKKCNISKSSMYIRITCMLWNHTDISKGYFSCDSEVLIE